MSTSDTRPHAAQPGYAFDLDTAVTRIADGAYTATVTDRWAALGGMPNGGYLLGICIEALRGDLPAPDPLAVSGFFLRAAEPGPAELRTKIVHAGRRHSTGIVTLTQREREIVRVVATFTDLARTEGRTLMLNEPPDLPPPESCVDPLGGNAFPGISITERVEYRMREAPGWLSGALSGDPRAEFWMRFKDGRPIDTIPLVALVDAAAPVVVELGEGSSTIELSVHVRARPSPSPWVACRASTRHVIGGYHEEDFEIWDGDGNLVAQSRQLAILPH